MGWGCSVISQFFSEIPPLKVLEMRTPHFTRHLSDPSMTTHPFCWDIMHDSRYTVEGCMHTTYQLRTLEQQMHTWWCACTCMSTSVHRVYICASGGPYTYMYMWVLQKWSMFLNSGVRCVVWGVMLKEVETVHFPQPGSKHRRPRRHRSYTDRGLWWIRWAFMLNSWTFKETYLCHLLPCTALVAWEDDSKVEGLTDMSKR